MSYVQNEARAAIRLAHEQAVADGVTDPQEIASRIDQAYPFLDERGYSRQVWLREHRAFFLVHNLPGVRAGDRVTFQRELLF